MSNRQKRHRPLAYFVAVFLACLLLCGIASAAPSITLSKKTGPPTSGFLVSGRGFNANQNVDIYFGSKDEAQVTTDSQGAFHNAKAYATRSAQPGEHEVKAVEQDNQQSAQQPFLVRANWTQFHRLDMMRFNPDENVLNDKNVGNLKLLWQYQTGGYVASSPAVSNGVVYVGSDDNKVYAIDAASGTKLWDYDAGNYVSYVDSSPAVSNGVVYFGSENGIVYALNARTGSKLWSYQTGDYVISSPAIVDGVVYVGSNDGYLYAFNATTGAVLWAFPVANGPWGRGVNSSPAVVNGVVYVGSNDYNVYAVDAKTGTELWSFATGYLVQSPPSVVDGVVYVGSADQNVYALNATTGTKLWSFQIGHSLAVYSSPAVANGVVYIGDSNIYALNAHTGKVLWRKMGLWSSSSPAIANGIVYLASGSGFLFALKASNGEKSWGYPISKEYIGSSPTVVNGKLYIGSDYNISAFGLPSGDETAASPRPALNALHPDFSLRASDPVSPF
jgi:outer membrane protein assembly factor BamB